MGTIYKLNFSNNKCYIGKTSNPLELRLRFHRNNKGQGCPLLKLAYDSEVFLDYEVLEDNIPLELLDDTERYYISTLKPELNTLPGGEGLNGLNHPRSKYTKDQIEQVVELFLNTAEQYLNISEITGVAYNTVQDICKQRSHAWVWELIDPKLYQAAILCRKPKYQIYDAYNELFEFDNLHKFCIELDIAEYIIRGVLDGATSTSGWSLTPHEDIVLVGPNNETINTNIFLAKQLLKSHNLSKFQITQLLTKRKPSGGWSCLGERKSSIAR